MFLTTFRRFPTTCQWFPKIFQNCSKGLTNVSEHFSNFFPKIAEDFRSTDDVSIIQHHLWVLFNRLCSYSNGNLKTSDSNLLFSRVRISCYLHVWRYHVYARKLTLYFTGVYIIKKIRTVLPLICNEIQFSFFHSSFKVRPRPLPPFVPFASSKIFSNSFLPPSFDLMARFILETDHTSGQIIRQDGSSV